MPKIIRRALLEKLLRHAEVQTFLEDFHSVTGLRLSFRDWMGREMVSVPAPTGLCARMHDCVQGAVSCRRVQQKLLEAAGREPAVCDCEAGLREVAVPLRIGDSTLGYFSFGGFRTGSGGDPCKVQKILSATGGNFSPQEVTLLLESAPEVSEEAMDAYKRLVVMACRQFAHFAGEHFISKERPLPALAHRARRYIQNHALKEDFGLSDIARACAVSEPHLSRVFHDSTGLTVTEYTARLRVESAIQLLKTSSKSVTEIAFACGFQSISQFNRTFKKVTGQSPTEARRAMFPLTPGRPRMALRGALAA